MRVLPDQWGLLLVGLYFVGKSVGTVLTILSFPIPRYLQTPHEVQLSFYHTALGVACMVLEGGPCGYQGGPPGSKGGPCGSQGDLHGSWGGLRDNFSKCSSMTWHFTSGRAYSASRPVGGHAI